MFGLEDPHGEQEHCSLLPDPILSCLTNIIKSNHLLNEYCKIRKNKTFLLLLLLLLILHSNGVHPQNFTLTCFIVTNDSSHKEE